MFTALSSQLVYLMVLGSGLGWVFLVTSNFDRRWPTLPKMLGLFLVSGLMANYLLMLATGGLQRSWWFAIVVSLGFLGLNLYLLRSEWTQTIKLMGAWSWSSQGAKKTIGLSLTSLLVVFLAAISCLKIIGEPISRGDSQWIWFFQSKIIYFAEGINSSVEWDHPAIFFSHPDYPKLMSSLGAQLASHWPHWNEYVAKGSLFVLALPALLLVFGLFRYWGVFLFGFAHFYFDQTPFLYNGYMDGYLAIYGTLAVLYLVEGIRHDHKLDLGIGLACSSIVLNLKNEGLVFGLALIAASLGLLLLTWSRQKRIQITELRRWFGQPDRIVTVAFAMIGVLTLFIWSYAKNSLGIENDLKLGLHSLGQGLERLGSWQSVQSIVMACWTPIWQAVVICASGLVAHRWAVGRWPGRPVGFALLVTAIYSAGIIAVYFVTPKDLDWHLATSATRTMMLPRLLFFGATFLALCSIAEQGQEGRADQ